MYSPEMSYFCRPS